MQKHITILGALYLGFSLLGVLLALLLFIGVAGGGALSGDPQAALITTGVGGIIAVFFIVFSLPGIIGGYGLLTRKPWARILGIILGAISLLSVPFGTILGIYALWALTRPEAQHILSERGRF